MAFCFDRARVVFVFFVGSVLVKAIVGVAAADKFAGAGEVMNLVRSRSW
jgi:hypothetical protein